MEKYTLQKEQLKAKGITYEMVARKHGCRSCSVAIYLNGGSASKPLETTIEAMLAGDVPARVDNRCLKSQEA